MLTWLDQIVGGLVKKSRAMAKKRFKEMTDRQVACAVLGAAMSHIADTVKAAVGDPDRMGKAVDALHPSERLLFGLFPFIGPLLLPEETKSEPLCIQVTPELLAALQGCSCPPSLRASLETRMKKHGVIYLDMPRVTRAQEGELAPEAIFLGGRGIGGSPSVFVSSLDDQGRRDYGAWSLNHHASEAYGLSAAVDRIQDEEQRQHHQNWARWAAEMVDFTALVVAYYETKEGEESFLPHLPEARSMGLPKERQAQLHKKFSLFVVRRLGEPKHRKLWPSGPPKGGGWKLEERIQVRAHPKMQHYGEGRKLRKLIIVGAYERGPKDAPMALVLNRLEGDHENGSDA